MSATEIVEIEPRQDDKGNYLCEMPVDPPCKRLATRAVFEVPDCPSPIYVCERHYEKLERA